jgi:hypothetical protein
MKKILTFIILISLFLMFSSLYSQIRFEDKELVKTIILDDGREVDQITVPGGYRPADYVPEDRNVTRVDVFIAGVPGFDWAYGCSPTSAAMAMGYYDRTSYPNMYAGPTNGGVCPIPTTAVPVWGSTYYGVPPGLQPVWCYECPLSATHNTFDGLATDGHVDDYWIGFGQPGPDPWNASPPEHPHADCTADFMLTSQWSAADNASTDGSTRFWYWSNGAPMYTEDIIANGFALSGIDGLKSFIESRGYNVYTDGVHYQIYNQYIYGWNGNTLGFTFTQYQAEIDAGRPVLIHVEGHTMTGVGYCTDSGNEVLLHDTWGFHRDTRTYTPGRMPWAGTYSGRAHKGVSVVHLAATGTYPGLPSNPTPSNGASGVGINTGLSWTNGSDTEDVDVYFSSTQSDVTNKLIGARIYTGTAVTSLDSTYLSCSYFTTYYWRVVAQNSNRLETDGPIWNFTTENAAGSFNPPRNLNASVTGNDVNLSWNTPSGGGTQTELIYHESSAWYFGLPDPNSITCYWQKFSPTNNGTLDTLKLFLYPSGYTPHNGTLNLNIYDTPGGTFQGGISVSTDTMVDGIYYFDMSSVMFSFTGGVDFYIQMSFSPDTGTDIIGFVIGDLDNGTTITYDGHSTFEIGGNPNYWWTNGGGTPYDELNLSAIITYTARSEEIESPLTPQFISLDNLNENNIISYSYSAFSKNLSAVPQLPLIDQSNLDDRYYRRERALSGYKIYRNGVSVHTITNPADTSYTDLGLLDGSYTYYVTATYSSPDGESLTGSL